MNFQKTGKYNFFQKCLCAFLIALIQSQVVLLAFSPTNNHSKSEQNFVVELTNKDILEMIKMSVSAEIIIAKIKNSVCRFDTSPTVINELKKAGASDQIILAMIQAPQASNLLSNNDSALSNMQPTAPSNLQVNVPSSLSASSSKKGEIKIPDGTSVEVELTYTVSSDEVQEGSTMSFRTIRPVKINGITVIEGGVSAIARVQKANGGQSWGRSGKVLWAMQGTTAVDGSNVPLQFERKAKGEGKGGQVATGAVVTSLIFLPAGLLWGFKKGKAAKIPAGTRYEVFTFGDVTINSQKSAAELTALSSGVTDLNGTWNFGGQLVQVNQNNQNVVINYVSGKSGCGGTVSDYVFQGQIQGSKLSGKMPVCTPPEYVKSCGMPPINELAFTADVTYGKISGIAVVPNLSVTPTSGGCSMLRDKRQDREFSFSLSRVVNFE